MVNLTHHLHAGRRGSKQSEPRSSTDDSRADVAGGDDETVVDEEQGNVLSHIISQLRPGADLSRVTLPTFILEPRSMLERITNFMAHPEVFLHIAEISDPVQRFVAVIKFYMSGWHIKPPGVKKPLNPILGETFYSYWDYEDGTRGYYVSEQTSHHPPKSSYFFAAPEHHIRIDGTLKPRSKFLGNSAASLMEGLAVLRLTDKNERYFITQPNMYARGILFGRMKYELGDHSFVRCPETGLEADIEFKTKGYFSGKYDAIGGVIKDRSGKALFEISGFWNGEMDVKDNSSGKKSVLFDATRAVGKFPTARPIEEQEEHESQRLWQKVNIAIKNRDHEAATDEKTKIEDAQRGEAQKHGEDNFQPRFFRRVQGGPGGPDEGEGDLDWILNAKIHGSPQEQVSQILSLAPILPRQLMGNAGARGAPNQQQQQQQPPQRQFQQAPSHAQQAPMHAQQAPAHFQQAPPYAQQQMPVSNHAPIGTGRPVHQSAPHAGASVEQITHDMKVTKLKRQDSDTNELDTFVDAKQH